MIEKAREHALYDRLLTEDLMAPLNEPGAAYDLILTTDVFIYLGDLDEVFRACARVLPPGGLFAFSLEAHEGDKPYVLNTTGRYAHSLDYIRQLGTKYGLHLVRHESCTLRKEHGQPVAGTLCLMVPSSGIAEA